MIIPFLRDNNFSPLHSQDRLSNSPYHMLHNSYNVSEKNLVLEKLIIPLLIFSLFFPFSKALPFPSGPALSLQQLGIALIL